jgi:Family of unknown function (DUF5681)
MRNNAFPSGRPAEEEYKVGPGRLPKEHQFKQGQSGNPKGAKRKAPSLIPDLKEIFESASSRRLETERRRNFEVISLLRSLKPTSGATIAPHSVGVPLVRTAGPALRTLCISLFAPPIRGWTIICGGSTRAMSRKAEQAAARARKISPRRSRCYARRAATTK